LREFRAFIVKFKGWLGHKWNALQAELQGQALLINSLRKAAALVLINFKASSDDLVRFLTINDLGHRFLFVPFVSFVGNLF